MMLIPVTQFPLEFLTCEASHLLKCLLWKSEPIDSNEISVFLPDNNLFFSCVLCRDTVKAAFLTVPRKYQADTSAIRLNSTDCSNEVEDDMLPWLPEDIAEDTTVVTIQ